MPALTSAQIKNFVRRSLRELVDPSPNKDAVTTIWAFFENRCAYCNCVLLRENKEGHIDHLVSASQAGANHISNRVLSCAKCNEKEKLDRDWREFLRSKAPADEDFRSREARILRWVESAAAAHPLDPALIAEAFAAASEVNELFDSRYKALRQRARESVRAV